MQYTKQRMAHIQMENKEKVKWALRHIAKPYQGKMIGISDKVYYKKEINGKDQEK